METTEQTNDPTVERMRSVMARLGLNQARMSEYLGVPQGTIGNWMAGTRQPNAVVVRLLDVLGTIEALAPSIHEGLMPGGNKR